MPCIIIIIYRQIATAYVGATTGAVFASVGLNSLLAVSSNQIFKSPIERENILITESTSIAETMGTIWGSSCSQLCQYPHDEAKVVKIITLLLNYQLP